MANFLCIDIGTTSVKVCIFDTKGKIYGISIKEYKLLTAEGNIVELPVQIYWKNCKDGIKEAIGKSGISAGNIKSISICGQGETLILLDKRGNPIRNAIVWMDNRSEKEAQLIKEKFGVDRRTGQTNVSATWPVTKILWLKKNEPECFKNVYKYLLPEDYLIYKLTNEFTGEFSLYSSSYMLDIFKKTWLTYILDYAGIELNKLSRLTESGEVAGFLSKSAADETGLKKGIPVISGAMDQISAMVGSGNIKGGMVSETTGAAIAVCATVDKIPSNRNSEIAIQCHAIKDKYVLIGWCPTGGMVLKWLRDNILSGYNYEEMMKLAEKVKAGSEGLIFFPYFAGPGTVKISSAARGMLYGLELVHKKSHIIRSVMESIAFILKEIIDSMSDMGLKYSHIRSLGGGAKSSLWNQIKSDILNKEVQIPVCEESACLGLAILQAKACGYYKTIEEAVKNMVRIKCIYHPSMENNKIYRNIYLKYLKLSREVFKK